MTREKEAQLLENVLDGLDRLFDDECTAMDTWALVFATSEALRGTEHSRELERALELQSTTIRSGGSKQAKRDLALSDTDQLRHYLADLLPLDPELIAGREDP
ncbi:MAG: hypothetical protein HOW73_46515 [Polyangiaceae bacterium]|nr:hypothetical protein [Polyangiaceae bacterium]